MAISFQCSACSRQYNVDEKLAGKTVKCKGCGAAINVPVPQSDLPPVPDIFGLDASEGGTGYQPAGKSPGVTQKCPSCGAPLAEASRICLGCGLNLLTGQKPPAQVIDLAGEAENARRRRRRYVRLPGNPILEQMDEIYKLVVALMLVAGIVMWIVQLAKGPAEFSAASLAPVALLFFIIAGVMTPLTAIGINIVVKKFNYVPRNDMYARTLSLLMFPFCMSLLFGWPALAGRFGAFVTLSWVLFPVLLVYLLRGETVDWVASMVTAVVTIALGWLLAGFIAMGFSQMQPLYADALPGLGPWTSLATGHSPGTTKVESQPAIASTGTAPVPTVASGDVTPVIAVKPNPTQITTPTVTPAIDPAVVTPPTNPVVVAPTPTPPVTPTRTAARKISSPFLNSVVADEPGLKNVSDVIVGSPSNPYILVVKNAETTSTVERWSVSPLEKKGDFTVPYYANKPSTFALGPKGDVLVTLVLFPRSQLELSYFDGKTPKKVVALDALTVVPSLFGFLDGARFGVRGDFDNSPQRTIIQLSNAASGQPQRELRAVPQIIPDPNGLVISPNAHFMAGVGTDRMVGIYNIENGTGQALKEIPISNNIAYKLVKLVFSPDSNQIAVYAVVDEVPTIQAFKIPNGEPTYSSVISKKPQHLGDEQSPGRPRGLGRKLGDPNVPHMNNDFLWLQDGKHWLVNGNELIDAPSGRKIGSLDLDDVADQYLIGTNSILFVQIGADNSRNLVLAKIDDTELKAATDKLK